MKNKILSGAKNMDMDSLLPGVSVDCVAIGFEENELKVLVLKWKMGKEMWTLPGGFVFKNEGLNEAASRVLKERTGINIPFLEQFQTFGEIDRRKPGDISSLMNRIESVNPNKQWTDWFSQRFITTGYVSLIDIQKCELKPDYLSEEIKWASLDEIPELSFDHNRIVSAAVKYLRNQINYLPIGLNLLPKKFTMKELQMLYESILDKKLDRGNFQRKMLKLNIFIRHEKQHEGGAHKAPYLYSFDKQKYQELLEKGFGFSS